MSSRSGRRGAPGAGRGTAKALGVLAAVALVFGTGCWENWAPVWFPMMKRQPAVQAYEETGLPAGPGGLMPAEGSVPVDGGEAPMGRYDPAADALENPFPRDDLRSLANGRVQYESYCQPCHGATGMAEGPVAKVFVGVFPLVGLTTSRSDGYIYNVIRNGAGGQAGLRMPDYRRIAPDDRWDIVNYVRYLDRLGGRPPSGGRP